VHRSYPSVCLFVCLFVCLSPKTKLMNRVVNQVSALIAFELDKRNFYYPDNEIVNERHSHTVVGQRLRYLLVTTLAVV